MIVLLIVAGEGELESVIVEEGVMSMVVVDVFWVPVVGDLGGMIMVGRVQGCVQGFVGVVDEVAVDGVVDCDLYK